MLALLIEFSSSKRVKGVSNSNRSSSVNFALMTSSLFVTSLPKKSLISEKKVEKPTDVPADVTAALPAEKPVDKPASWRTSKQTSCQTSQRLPQ
jgi:hypothetical protein